MMLVTVLTRQDWGGKSFKFQFQVTLVVPSPCAQGLRLRALGLTSSLGCCEKFSDVFYEITVKNQEGENFVCPSSCLFLSPHFLLIDFSPDVFLSSGVYDLVGFSGPIISSEPG